MDDVLNEVDILIDKLSNADFVKNMHILKNTIDSEHLINTNDVKKLYSNDTIHSYIENQNILDYHIYYLNKEINKLISNKICKE